MEGPFDFIKTPMSILGTKGLAYLDPDDRASWQPHGVDAFYTGRKPMHYRLLEMFDPNTRSYRTVGTYKLYPSHCKVLTISEADRTIIAAAELLDTIRVQIPTQADTKRQHLHVIEQLTEILDNAPPPRVDGQSAPRVGHGATTSTDKTSPRVVKQTRASTTHEKQQSNAGHHRGGNTNECRASAGSRAANNRARKAGQPT